MLVSDLVEIPHEKLADWIALHVTGLSRGAVLPALGDALAAEAARPDAEVRRPVLFRLFVAWRRAAGRDPGYDPSLSPEQVRALVAGLPRGVPEADHAPRAK